MKFLVIEAARHGYGGTQKVGYRYAIQNGFDAVAVLDGNMPNSEKILEEMARPFHQDPNVVCVLGVPRRRNFRNWIFTGFHNRLTNTRLKDWHTPYRAYRTTALEGLAFAFNTNDFHFDTELLLQLLHAGLPMAEAKISIEKSGHPGGFRYIWNSLKAGFKFFLQKYNLFYDVRFHPEMVMKESDHRPAAPVYQEKSDSRSPHSTVCRSSSLVPEGSKVLDIGSSSGYVAEELVRHKNCRVTAVDLLLPSQVASSIFQYEKINLETEEDKLVDLAKKGDFDVVLMLDVIEHLTHPERFLSRLSSLPYKKTPRFICSTANVGFFVIRLMLLLGHFNYGQKGILDITHKRLFSVHTFRNLMEQTGFVTQNEIYFPFPFRALGLFGWLSAFLEKVNVILIKIRPRLFSYQVMLETVPLEFPKEPVWYREIDA